MQENRIICGLHLAPGMWQCTTVFSNYTCLYISCFPLSHYGESKTNAYPTYCPCLQVLLRMFASHREHSQHDPVALALQYPNYKVPIVTLNNFLRTYFFLSISSAIIYTFMVLFMVEIHKRQLLLSNVIVLLSSYFYASGPAQSSWPCWRN